MKITSVIALSSPLLLALNSCAPPAQNSQNAGGTYSDPNNPYAVPGMTTQGAYAPAEQAPYQENPNISSAPYQAIPSNEVNPPATSSPAYTPSAPNPTPSTGGGAAHVVASGDTLWGLSRKYNVSVADIKQANGLTGDTIMTGQTLRIPQ
jgi:LysM repeat protein